jgi:polyhydroxyalkanoate synthesis repressor PhaR
MKLLCCTYSIYRVLSPRFAKNQGLIDAFAINSHNSINGSMLCTQHHAELALKVTTTFDVMLHRQQQRCILTWGPFFRLFHHRAMPTEPIRIKRYPNRRFYASHTSRYVSLPEIEQMICDGATVEIRDSQSGDDITRSVLVQIIAEKHPDKIAMFPTALLHSMLRANDVMVEFLREYFRNSIAFLDYFQKQGASGPFPQPMDWLKPWIENWSSQAVAKGAPKTEAGATPGEDREIAERMARLEKRIAELETQRAAED